MGNDGTLYRRSAAYAASGRFGQALSDGVFLLPAVVDAHLSATGVAGGSLTGTGTVEGWIKTTAGDLRVWVGRDNWYWIGVDGGKVRALYGSTTGAVVDLVGFGPTVADGAWHHVALVFTAGAGALYVDGSRVATSTTVATTGTSESGGALLGGFTATYPVYDWAAAGGQIDEVRVSKVARYTGASFTVPTAALAGETSNTTGLYHLNGSAADATTGPVAPPPPPPSTAPTVGAITVATAGGTDTISYPAPVAGTTPVGGVTLYGSAVAADPDPAVIATRTTTGAGTFTTPTPSSGRRFYTVRAFDTATPPLYSTPSNEVVTGVADGIIYPNDPGLSYSPGVWSRTTARARTINAGAYVRGYVTGGAGSVTFAFDLAGIVGAVPRIRIAVDGVTAYRGPVAATVTVTPPTTSTWTKHYVDLVVVAFDVTTPNRWDPQGQHVTLTRITTDVPTATLQTVTAPSTLRGLVIGDSLVEGVRTLGSTQAAAVDQCDAEQGWAYQLTRTLGAQVGVVGFGGQGYTTSSGVNGNVPIVTTTYGSLWPGQARSFTGLDFVVVAHGANDGGATTTAAATALLNGLLAVLPPAAVVLVFLPLGQPAQATNLRAAVAACTSPRRVTYVDTTGWMPPGDADDVNLHPLGYVNAVRVSPLAAQAIRAAFARGGRFINVGGAAKPVAGVIR